MELIPGNWHYEVARMKPPKKAKPGRPRKGEGRAKKEARLPWPDRGIRLRKIRYLAGFRKRQGKAFAVSIDINPKTWSRWENGGMLGVEQARRIKKALKEKFPGLTLDYIYEGDVGGVYPADFVEKLSTIEVPTGPDEDEQG